MKSKCLTCEHFMVVKFTRGDKAEYDPEPPVAYHIECMLSGRVFDGLPISFVKDTHNARVPLTTNCNKYTYVGDQADVIRNSKEMESCQES